MKKQFILTLGVAFLVFDTATSAESPKGWFRAGSQPANYEMSVDRTVIHSGKASASLKNTAGKAEGFGTMMQMFKADSFRSHRVRMSAFVKSENASEWAGLWMRVDGAASSSSKVPESLAFDNMQKRPIKGSSDWTRYEIVLDVPEGAREIAFGLLLTGRGQVWLDDIKFEIVGDDVPTTDNRNESEGKMTPRAPVNLDFEM